jgi:phosphate transport system substrate-binding protein
MKRVLTFLATLLAALAILPSAQAAGGKLVLTGSSTVTPLALEISKRFEAMNPGVRVDVQSGDRRQPAPPTRRTRLNPGWRWIAGIAPEEIDPAQASSVVGSVVARHGKTPVLPSVRVDPTTLVYPT